MYNGEKGGEKMDIELVNLLQGTRKSKWCSLLQSANLSPDGQLDSTVLVWEDENLIATGSRWGNILKCIAVDDHYRGQDLTATVITKLRQDAFEAGYSHLFLYTKPQNEFMFSSLLFYPIARTTDVLLMENRQSGIADFLASLPIADGKTVGAAVMHCDPFTKGHRYLIETAAKECDRVYIFVLSEDRGHFPAKDRLELVKKGTADLKNVTVLPTGPYLISAATFPTYFLKEQNKAALVQCQLDIEIFTKYFAPKFGITRRYVGTEPLCPITSQYNEALAAVLPEKGIQLRQVPRLELNGAPVSASAVRASLQDKVKLEQLVPETTLDYLVNL